MSAGESPVKGARSSLPPFSFCATLWFMTDVNSYVRNGWQLSEFTHWISQEDRQNFLKIVGHDNIVILDQEESPAIRGWRAKMLISPPGIKILDLLFMPVAGNA